ncbi:MAG: FkbM family methyltransferase [Planctomycetota bacterium]|jgi:FkbM family methyltransferase
MKNIIKNVLWLRTDSIGDAILSSSMLPYVQKAFAPAKITVVCQDHIAPLYEECPFVDWVITLPSEHKWQSQAQYEAVIENVRKLEPGILLNSTFATHGLADIPGLEFIPTRVAFRNVRNASYTDIIPTEMRQKPELERHRDFLASLGIDVPSLKTHIWINQDDDNFAGQIFNKHSLDPDRTIAIFAGTRTHHRRYEHYGQALNRICKQNGYSLIALGSHADYTINQQNLEAAGAPAVNLSGKTTLRQTAAILKHCRLAVGAETANAHIACAVETPNVILLGGGHFGRFMPYSPLTSAVCLPLDCFGCDWKCRYDKIHCVADVSAEVLADAVSQTLGASSEKPRVFTQPSLPLNTKPQIKTHKNFDHLIDTDSVEIIPVHDKAMPVGHENSPNPQIDVSVILCTKNRASLLDPMLASLKKATEGINWEMIVIDGGSNDNTLDVLQAHGIRDIYDETQCLGPGRHSWPQLYNFGFTKARGKWAIYASDDILFSDGCISRAVKMLNEQADEVAGGIFFYKNMRAAPGWEHFGIDFAFGPKLLMNYGLVRLDYFRAVGGLDEAYRFYCADSDLCLKLYQSGKQLIPMPYCFVVHDNILDVTKQTNSNNSEADIQLYKQRWQHFVSLERPDPRRLLWQQDIDQSFNLPASLAKIDSAIEHFWHGLACFQQSMFVRAKMKFLQAVQSACDHWLVLWYLARAAFESSDEPVAKKSAQAVLQFVPDFTPAKNLLTKLDSDSGRHPLEGRIDASTLGGEISKNIKVYNDNPSFDNAGFNDNNYLENGEFELIRQLIKADDVVFDIGANTGDWSALVLSSIASVKLHSFEPVGDVFTRLQTNLRGVEVFLYNIAFSDKNEARTFFYYNKTLKLARLSTFYRRCEKIEHDLDIKPVQITVQARTLDSFCSENEISHIDYLKIDTEGAELDVLRGAAGMLRAHRVRKIQFEYGGNYSDARTTLRQVCELLTSYGYSIFRVIPWGLTHIGRWRDTLENYQYSNYVAVCPELAGKFKLMEGIVAPNVVTHSAPKEQPCLPSKVEKETVGLIFSKDRPIQLDATIQSFKMHCSDSAEIKLHVLYKASNQMYSDQYNKLKNNYTDIEFVKETDFKAQTLAVVRGSEHVLFLVDDNIFVRNFSLADTIGLLNKNHNAIAFSLRLGKNTTYSYARNRQVPLPHFWYATKSILKYDWTNSQSHFAYPLEVSSSIYRTADIEPLLEQLSFDGPNMLEGLAAANAQIYAKSRPAMLCFEQSVTFCNPINIVQNVSENRAGNIEKYSTDSLAKMFEQGLRIDVKHYAGFLPNSPHQEVELKFTQSHRSTANDQPLVTVEMIAYNAEKYIAAAIDSVLAQTYENFELLIIDDGSTDRTNQIINSYHDTRIRYIHKQHKNRWSGTNIAISQAKGQYIITVDSDDFIAADYIEKMVAAAQSRPEIDYFYPACLTIVDALGNTNGNKWEYIDFPDNTILPRVLFENAFSPIPHPGGMKRISLYHRLGGYEEVQNTADFVFLCKNALNIRFMRVAEHSIYFYRLLPTSLSHKFEARNKITADILNEMVSIYPQNILCPDINSINDPAQRQRQYYKFLMDIFYKHVHGHRVKFGEYFRQYGDYYKNKLLDSATAVNSAASSVVASSNKREIGQLKNEYEERNLLCRK